VVPFYNLFRLVNERVKDCMEACNNDPTKLKGDDVLYYQVRRGPSVALCTRDGAKGMA
jgi:hypothetical protein